MDGMSADYTAYSENRMEYYDITEAVLIQAKSDSRRHAQSYEKETFGEKLNPF